MTKNSLVMGGAGYIGSHSCQALAQEDYLPLHTTAWYTDTTER